MNYEYKNSYGENTVFDSLEEAIEYAKEIHEEVEVFDDRVLCWDSEEDAEDDDGACAAASITWAK